MAYIDRAFRDVVHVIRAILVQRDLGEVIVLIVLVRVKLLRAAANGDLCRRGRVACRAVRTGLTGIGVKRHQIIRASLGERIGIVVAVSRSGVNFGNQAPILIIDRNAQAGDGLECLAAALCNRARVILDRGKVQGVARLNGIIILIKRRKRTLCPELPVAEHGKVNRVAVRQQDVVRRRAPARPHQGIDMVAVVHEVFVVTPELLHIHRRCRTGDVQHLGLVHIGLIAVHVVYAFFETIRLRQPSNPVFQIILVISQIVYAEHIQVQVQRGGALYNLVVNVAAPAAIRVVTVEISQSCLFQIEVRNLDLQV